MPAPAPARPRPRPRTLHAQLCWDRTRAQELVVSAVEAGDSNGSVIPLPRHVEVLPVFASCPVYRLKVRVCACQHACMYCVWCAHVRRV